jgi:hypothetical protein
MINYALYQFVSEMSVIDKKVRFSTPNILASSILVEYKPKLSNRMILAYPLWGKRSLFRRKSYAC